MPYNPLETYSATIRGLDCMEEVTALKSTVGKLDGVEKLDFDLLNGRMTVEYDVAVTNEDEILNAVKRSGLSAAQSAACTCHSGDSVYPADESFWQKHGRNIAALGGFLLLVIAFLIHTFYHGFLDSLTGGFGDEDHVYPALSIALYIPSIFFSYWFILPKALNSLRSFRPDMNLLMTVAVIGACAIGEWFEGATVAWLFAVALILESWSIGKARRAVAALMSLAPDTARYISPHDGDIVEKPVSQIPLDATVIVRPGEKIPLDGSITKGFTSVNEAPITGESTPVSKEPGDQVFAGTINNEGAFEFTATKPADDTTLARIIRMVEEAQSRRAPSEKWVEKFARWYTPAVFLLAAAIALVPPIFFGDFNLWLYKGLVILVIACPCALVISTPVSIVAGLASAAKNGILVKGGIFLEMPARLLAIAIDKTGTITTGRPIVAEIAPLNNHTEEELLARCAALESKSEHPYARAIVECAEARGIEFKEAESFTAIPGKGAVGVISGREYFIGSHRLMHERGYELPQYCDRANELESAGCSIITVGNDRHVCGIIGISDAIRDNARTALKGISDAGVKHIVMLTGDNERAARAVARKCGIEDVRAGLLPEDKVNIIRELALKGGVAMVGDGVNDAPALAASNLGIAMAAAGSDAAIETADIALMSDDLSKLPWLIRHSRRTLGIIKANIVFAVGLKAVFLALALAGIATLWMAILADTGASLIVIANSLRLLRGVRE